MKQIIQYLIILTNVLFVYAGLLHANYNSYSASNISTPVAWSKTIKGFEPNVGQLANIEGKGINNILFSIKGPYFSLYFKTNGVSYTIYQTKEKTEQNSPNTSKSQVENESNNLHYARVDLDLLKANIQKANIVYQDELPGYSNYYLPHCPEGVLNVKSYRKVIVKNVYPGIDWIFRCDERGELHHEFEVKPQADVNQIRFRVKWAHIQTKKNRKQVVLFTPLGQIRDGEIISYSETNSVDVRYQITNGVISYDVRNWNRRNKLTIDPPLGLLWATYYGGNGDEVGKSVVTDTNGNIYLTGWTKSTNFPTYNPGGGAYFQGTYSDTSDVFILKFSNTGVRLWATYYGGSDGDYGSSVTVDVNGNLFVTGNTFSSNFPTQNPGGSTYFQSSNAGNSDAFILKFNSSGIRQWATYYGGSNFDIAHSISKDGSGNIFLTGATSSTNFPTFNPGSGAYYQSVNAGNMDVFLLKFNNQGIRQWATYYGGSNGNEEGYCVTSDGTGNIFITGYTSSVDFPKYTPGGGVYFQGTDSMDTDAFIMKFSNTGTRLWATAYGGQSSGWEADGIDYGYSVVTDSSGNVFVTGATCSEYFPTYNPGGGAYYQPSGGSGGVCIPDAFILKFNNSGIRLWATYYGSVSFDYGYAITTDRGGNVYVAGTTGSSSFPTYNPGGGAYFQGTYGGNQRDGFILKFTNSGVRIWGTFYGGNGNDYAKAIGTDRNNNIFVTGWTGSTNFPLYNAGGGSYFQPTYSGGNLYGDVFILKFEGTLTSIEQVKNKIPNDYKLKHNYPNPFNPITNIEFDIPKSSQVRLAVYDINGHIISTIVNTMLAAGSYRVKFDGTNLSSGVYFYRFTVSNYTKTYKMILMK